MKNFEIRDKTQLVDITQFESTEDIKIKFLY
jgi:hypothetical protein